MPLSIVNRSVLPDNLHDLGVRSEGENGSLGAPSSWPLLTGATFAPPDSMPYKQGVPANTSRAGPAILAAPFRCSACFLLEWIFPNVIIMLNPCSERKGGSELLILCHSRARTRNCGPCKSMQMVLGRSHPLRFICSSIRCGVGVDGLLANKSGSISSRGARPWPL